ncbi:MAG: Zn-ribbon domain-containing OB-fold protein [Gammaproteobacteria bacterium]
MTKSSDKDLLRASFKLEYPYERSPGPIIGRFFEELSNEVLVGTKNSKGEIFLPAAEFDPNDSEQLNDFVEVNNEGVIHSYTWIEKPRTHHLLKDSFAFALICMNGTNSAMLHMIANCREDEIEIGKRVKVVWNEEKSQTIRDIKYFEIIDD